MKRLLLALIMFGFMGYGAQAAGQIDPGQGLRQMERDRQQRQEQMRQQQQEWEQNQERNEQSWQRQQQNGRRN